MIDILKQIVISLTALVVTLQASVAGLPNDSNVASVGQVLGVSTPILETVSPSSGTGISNAFTFVYSDADGVSDLTNVGFLINSQVDGMNSCWVNYEVVSNTVSLASNDTSNWSGSTPGSNTTIQNSQCSLNLSNFRVSTNGNNKILTVPIVFTTGFTGSKNIYMRAFDVSGAEAVFTSKGTWQVSSVDSIPPTIVIANPNSGSSVSGVINLTATASDNIGIVGVQFKLDGSNIGSELISAPYSTSLSTPNLSNSIHNITAVARDAAGNTTTSVSVMVTVNNNASSPYLGTGTHWPNISEFGTLKQIGYDFAIITVPSNYEPGWKQAIDAAETQGLKLIIGAWPPPYSFNQTTKQWTVLPEGLSFLNYLKSRPTNIAAVFVFNEPYWTDPVAGGNYPCGFYSVADLRSLRTSIRNVWSDAKIYHDMSSPKSWAPGGPVWGSCNDASADKNKYADQTGIADYVGVWYYPFRSTGFNLSNSLATLSSEAQFVTNSMSPAKPILLGQGHTCNGCESGGVSLVWPTQTQLKDWNCAIRQIPSGGISWYVWRQLLYPDYLLNHPNSWSLTSLSACEITPDTTPPSTPTNLSASAISSSQINLSWSASTDNVGVTGYKVYRGGTLLTTLGNVTTYSNTSLSASTNYSYTVSAYDAAGNTSSQSTSKSATTQSSTPIVGDFNRDGIVNSIDLSLLTSYWNQNNSTYDLNHDSIVNSLDYVIMVQNWSL